MILIRTKDGAVILNDSYITDVRYFKNTKRVLVFFKSSSTTICDVESVTYANNSQPTEWKENGYEVEYLTERVKHVEKLLRCQFQVTEETENRLRELGAWCEDVPSYYKGQLPDDLSKRISERGMDAKSFVNNHEGRAYFEKAMAEKADAQLEADEVTRLNDMIDRMTRELDTAKEFEKRHREALERIMSRNLLERIINKKTYL